MLDGLAMEAVMNDDAAVLEVTGGQRCKCNCINSWRITW